MKNGPEDGLIHVIPDAAAITLRNLTFQYEGPNSNKVLDQSTWTYRPIR